MEQSLSLYISLSFCLSFSIRPLSVFCLAPSLISGNDSEHIFSAGVKRSTLNLLNDQDNVREEGAAEK